ncbi:MAG: hypothetical protein GY903_28650 [Fuerstiella sp.]|nr:hypothetical protein [Fuerstiella sp.]MCP4858465.1 hypothetical protein [Fuerstiella sp.]
MLHQAAAEGRVAVILMTDCGFRQGDEDQSDELSMLPQADFCLHNSPKVSRQRQKHYEARVAMSLMTK